ncbi:uracil-DNA glycosylase, Uracil-DNA glycosylase-like protein [Artemisia annua]|uniref:Uracil-DNA glycosylase, Uracil-DNA glycosylase-like protein n=1 Tax=Artemisia annua TaxID=35608 RepID=A0A2U1LD37_ARTAN|nr:uracil-DNA glycosylase, Uracil-DNA glycosylase-like protein [Artemisia annua]
MLKEFGTVVTSEHGKRISHGNEAVKMLNRFEAVVKSEQGRMRQLSDPYHGPGQPMGLSFSVPEGIKVPSTLMHMYNELQQDLGCSIPSHGNLEWWTVQGVLLLNVVLTASGKLSCKERGWVQFTDSVIETISKKKTRIVFLLGETMHKQNPGSGQSSIDLGNNNSRDISKRKTFNYAVSFKEFRSGNALRVILEPIIVNVWFANTVVAILGRYKMQAVALRIAGDKAEES